MAEHCVETQADTVSTMSDMHFVDLSILNPSKVVKLNIKRAI